MPNTHQMVPIDALKWKVVDDYRLSTILGSDLCKVEKLDSDQYDVLRPGEDDRIKRAQIKLFCAWLIEEKQKTSPEQLRYILHTLELKQTMLARAMLLSEGAVSQFLNGVSQWKPSTHRQLALLILNEVLAPGYAAMLADNRVPLGQQKLG